MNIGKLIKEKRLSLKLSLDELSKRSGISSSYLHKIESGVKNHPSLKVVNKIFKVLDIKDEETTNLFGLKISDFKEMSFGEFMKNRRLSKGLSLSDLSEKCGYSPSYLHRLENQKNKTPSVEVAGKIAVALDFTDEVGMLLGVPTANFSYSNTNFDDNYFFMQMNDLFDRETFEEMIRMKIKHENVFNAWVNAFKLTYRELEK
jgi:transcriptional regulator with XRE-family HTH domain